MTRGLADSEIQLDLLGDKNQNITLEEVFQFIEAKEAGKQSAGRLLETQTTANATRSQYRHVKQEELKPHHPDKRDICHYCGQHGHGKRAPSIIRKNACPAYGKMCGHCGRPHHPDTVCRQKEKPKHQPTRSPTSPTIEAEGAIFDSLCTSPSSNTAMGKPTISLDHHLYSHLNDCWVRQASKPHDPLFSLKSHCVPRITKPSASTHQPLSVKHYNYALWPTLAARVA